MIRLNDVHAIKLIAGAANIQFVPKLHYCVASYDKNDILMGGTLYTDITGVGGSCQVHFAGFRPNWINKALLYCGFQYPFEQLGLKKIIGPIPEYNYKSRNMAIRLGFNIEYKIEDVFNYSHGINGMYITSMTRDKCRWLDMEPPEFDFAPSHLTSNAQLSVVGL
jgi:hypothetical protein